MRECRRFYLLRSLQIMVTCLAPFVSAASMASHANAPEPSTTTSCTALAHYSALAWGP